MKLELIMRNGARVVADIDRIAVQRSKVTGELAGMNWETPADANRSLVYLRLDEVVAAVTIHEIGDIDLPAPGPGNEVETDG
jgi:hypothetical protein